jgi:ribonucrease Y
MDPLVVILIAAGAALVGGVVAAIILSNKHRAALESEKRTFEQKLASDLQQRQTQLEGENAKALSAKKQALENEVARDRESAARELERAKRDAQNAADAEQRALKREQKLAERETSLDRKLEALDGRDTKLRKMEEQLAERHEKIDQRNKAIDETEKEMQKKLSEIAGLTPDQARETMIARLEASLTAEQAERIARFEKDTLTRQKDMSIEIVSRAVQRYAAEHTAETTVAKIKIADDDIKGRIIGKEGRNIKAFEQATGVDLLLDDQPGVITISCFSGLRREMARRTLETLIEDGRIHPGRIEEVMAKVQQDMDREVLKLGEEAAFQVDVSGLHPQLLRLLGKLQWRTSYGQNVLQHTKEVAFLCGAMAADMGMDAKLGRRCGLLHDIGKAIDHEQEGSHPELGYEALKRYGENEIVANAALAHHEGRPVLSAYTVLAAAADAISAARPGARSKNVEGYIKRLEKLEEIACAQHGVQKAYAIQAGRELRVIVSGKDVPDAELPKLARDIARRIEEEVQFPGEVKVTIIRELRHFAVAR